MAHLKIGNVRGQRYARIVETTRTGDRVVTTQLLWIGTVTPEEIQLLRKLLTRRRRRQRTEEEPLEFASPT
jgi:hypothetical protein